MLGYRLKNTYIKMLELGLTRSKRDFATRWLGRGKTYLRDFEYREGRDAVRVPPKTVARLRTRLRALADRMPAGVRADIEVVIHGIDQGTVVADLLARRE
jgi:hypothetical protein